jgi:ABC-type transport system involved in multi-copper enzyme maturation permease subunit
MAAQLLLSEHALTQIMLAKPKISAQVLLLQLLRQPARNNFAGPWVKEGNNTFTLAHQSRLRAAFSFHCLSIPCRPMLNSLPPFVLSTWRAGLRSRSIQAILIVGVLLMGVAFLSASFSPRQPKTVALDVGLSGIRVALVLLSLFWVQELVGQEIQRRTVLFALTYPVGRGNYILGRYVGILGLLTIAALLLSMLLWVVVLTTGGTYEQGFTVAPGAPYWTTVLGLWLDAAVVTAFATWIASLSTVNILPLALGFAFAVGGKSLGAVLQYMMQGADGNTQMMKLSPVVNTIQWVLPDLSRLDWRVWPMYDVVPDHTVMIGGGVMAISYIGVMLALAIFAFSRREFQ